MIRTKTQMIRKPRQPVEGVFCNYSHRTCMHNRLEGFEYCLKHILEDKTAPFKQCTYISGKTGKRCHNAAPKSDRKDGYCSEHSRKAAILRQKAGRKRRPKETAESLLEALDLHSSIPYGADRFLNTDVKKNSRLSPDSVANRVLDYASSSDSDAEPPLVDQAWRGDGESDAESIDSEQEDPLKHAGIYTAEEVALIMRDKLIRLQSLYIDQFKRLQHIMKEKRRRYLHTYKQERDTFGGIKAYKNNPEQSGKYAKLKAMKRYHKRYGKEALLHRHSKQRRIAASEGSNYKPPSYPKCSHVDSGVKCSQRTIPLSKFCTQHILSDPHQVLYRPCSFGGEKCQRPVFTIEDQHFCPLHVPLQEKQPRLSVKEEEAAPEIAVPPDEAPAADKIKEEIPIEQPIESPANDGQSQTNKLETDQSETVSGTELSKQPLTASMNSQILLQHLQGDGKMTIPGVSCQTDLPPLAPVAQPEINTVPEQAETKQEEMDTSVQS